MISCAEGWAAPRPRPLAQPLAPAPRRRGKTRPWRKTPSACSTTRRSASAARRACRRARPTNELPLDDNIGGGLWDTPFELSGKTYTVIKMYQDGTAAQQGSGQGRLRPHQAAMPALHRSLLRLGLPGEGHDQGSRDGGRLLQRGRLHRLPLLRRGVPIPRAAIPVRHALPAHRQVPALQGGIGQGRYPRLRQGVPDGRHALRQLQGFDRRDRPAQGA